MFVLRIQVYFSYSHSSRIQFEKNYTQLSNKLLCWNRANQNGVKFAFLLIKSNLILELLLMMTLKTPL